MKYEQSYNQLNKQQKKAVDTVEGPVMVIAGPGSGKTQILSTRVGNILNMTGVSPNNILNLTFTNAGVDAMRKRLIKFYGPTAYEFPIYTFHSLCNMIISTNEHLFGLRNSSAADEVKQMEVIKGIIDKLPGDHPLVNHNAPYVYMSNLKHLFSFMKQESFSVDDIRFQVDRYLEDLPSREDFQYKRGNKNKGIEKGDIKVAMVKKEEESMEKLLAGAELLNTYNSLLKENNLYDYDDMITMVVKELSTNEWLRRNFQERWLYIQVDESQDTNRSQFRLLHILSEFWGEYANVFIVGDDDQAIYEFQGARIQNLLDFEKIYPGLEKVVLDRNYRSGGNVIDFSQKLINNNELRLNKVMGVDKSMHAEAPYKAVVDVVEFQTKHDELAWVLDFLREIKGDELDSVGIIYSKHRQAEELIKLLEVNDIPYNAVRKLNVLTEKYVKNILTIIEYLMNPQEKDYLLFKIINFSFTPVQYKTAIKATMAIRDKDNPVKSYAEYLVNMGSKFMRFVEKAQELIYSETFDNFFYYVISGSGLLKHITDTSDLISLEAIKTITDYVKDYSVANNDASMEDLLNSINTMKENNYFMSKEVYFDNSGGVSLMTSHGAKGLEFDTVIMLDCGDAWEPGARRGKFKFPDTLTSPGDKGQLESSRRAFYVAMTRAKKELYLTYHVQKSNGKENRRSIFIEELMGDGMKEDKLPMPSSMTEAVVISTIQPKVFQRHLMSEEQMAKITENFTWSSTALNTYLKCQNAFYYKYILKVPEPSNNALTYGDAIHDGLYRAFMDHVKNVEPLSLELLFKYFHKNLNNSNPKMAHVLGPKGEIALESYWYNELSKYNMNTLQYAEKKLFTQIEGIPVISFIDRIDKVYAGSSKYIDYKTGKYKAVKFKEGSDYNNQMDFYFLVGYNYPYESIIPVGGEFHFIDTGEIITIDRDSKRIESIKTKLVESNSAIKKFEFSQGCNDKNCHWCNYHKDL